MTAEAPKEEFRDKSEFLYNNPYPFTLYTACTGES